ncbi:twin-arginine translocase TatA/TatE family subunit [Chloroflexota bacterium]
MPFRMGPLEIALILVVILIVFGVGKLPQVGGALGKGLRAFKKEQQASLDTDSDEPAAKSPRKVSSAPAQSRRKKSG